MPLEVVIPSVRPREVERLVYTLARNSMKPEQVTIVSNEADRRMPTHGLAVRILRFSSDAYPVGDRDVALRRNIGIWWSRLPNLLLLDDDELAPVNLVESSQGILASRPFFFGNYRTISFTAKTADGLIGLDPSFGVSREQPSNAWHGWQSCYGGLFGCRRTLLREIGAYDLTFLGRHGGEDQHLGRRLARHVDGRERVFIYEPPFVWHSSERLRWSETEPSNLCPGGGHLRTDADVGGLSAVRCRRCPWFQTVNPPAADDDQVRLPFDEALVRVTVETCR